MDLTEYGPARIGRVCKGGSGIGLAGTLWQVQVRRGLEGSGLDRRVGERCSTERYGRRLCKRRLMVLE
jgi:hypothetical protein